MFQTGEFPLKTSGVNPKSEFDSATSLPKGHFALTYHQEIDSLLSTNPLHCFGVDNQPLSFLF